MFYDSMDKKINGVGVILKETLARNIVYVKKVSYKTVCLKVGLIECCQYL